MAVISAPLANNATPGRGGGWRDLDWPMLLIIGLLAIWSCFTILSATRTGDDVFRATPTASISRSTTRGTAATGTAATGTAATGTAAAGSRSRSERFSDAMKQAVWILLGLALLALFTLGDFQMLMPLQFWAYVLTLAILGSLLILPDSLTPVINGAKSWIRFGPFAIQPSEFAKFGIIISLAAFLAHRQERIRQFSTIIWSLVYLVPPLLLIMKQPDFGTTLAVLSIWFGMLFFGGARLWHLGLIVAVGALMFGAAWKTGKLKPHQKARLAVFLNNNPTSRDDKAAGYQIKQSQIAIGSGQISGQGWGQGMQNRAGYVPENTTDFIFTVVAEEQGFIGGAILVLCYLILLLRSCSIAMSTDNYFGALIAGGFTALLAFHSIINLGMTMRVMPITGVPLPFFSYGGSSFLAFSLCAGLLQSIAMRRRRTGTF